MYLPLAMLNQSPDWPCEPTFARGAAVYSSRCVPRRLALGIHVKRTPAFAASVSLRLMFCSVGGEIHFYSLQKVCVRVGAGPLRCNRTVLVGIKNHLHMGDRSNVLRNEGMEREH